MNSAKNRIVKFPNLTHDAKYLNVSRTSVYKILTGDPAFKCLKTLRKRYVELLLKKPEAERNYIISNISDEEILGILRKAGK